MFLRRGLTSKHLQKQRYKKLGKPPNFITLFNGKVSRESKNLSPMALFTPTEGVKREGSKAGWRGSKIYILEHILHYSQELEEVKREREGERMTF